MTLTFDKAKNLRSASPSNQGKLRRYNENEGKSGRFIAREALASPERPDLVDDSGRTRIWSHRRAWY